MNQIEAQRKILAAYAHGLLPLEGESLMTKKQARKRKQRPAKIVEGIGPISVGNNATPQWYGLHDLRPDVAGMYLIIGHEGKAIGGRMIQTVYAPSQMIAHFEDMAGERIGLHCIKSVYGPIPEENPNG